MKKFSFTYFDYIRTILLIFILLSFIHIIYFIMFPHEAFAMTPEEIQIYRTFDPDTYIRHELDGTPIHVSGRAKYYYRDDYHLCDTHVPKSLPVNTHTYYHLDPTVDRHELDSNPINKQSLKGELRYNLQASQHLYDTVKNKLFVEAKNKQRRCGSELPVYHKSVIDLYNKSDSSTKYGTKKSFGIKILKWINNEPLMDYDEYSKWMNERKHRAYLDKLAHYKELIRAENERMARYHAKFNKRR